MTPDDNVANKTETEVNPEQRQGVAVTRILQTWLGNELGKTKFDWREKTKVVL